MTTKQLRRKRSVMQRRAKKQWRHLSAPQRSVLVVGVLVQVTLLAAAQIDIGRRPSEAIRGSKLVWRLVVLINFVGPLAYFAFGRRQTAPDGSARQPATESVVA